MAAVAVEGEAQRRDHDHGHRGVDDGADVAPGVLDAPPDGVGELVALDLFTGQTLIHQTNSGKVLFLGSGAGRAPAGDSTGAAAPPDVIPRSAHDTRPAAARPTGGLR